MDAIFQSFADNISKRYDLSILNIVYDTIDIGPHKGRPRLNLIFEDQKSFDTIHTDRFTISPHIKTIILREFSNAVAEFNKEDVFDTQDVH